MPRVNIPLRLEQLLFDHRRIVISLFVLITTLMFYSAMELRIDARFGKLLPLNHDYMQTFVKYRQEFSSANRILIALVVKDGDIFTPEFFSTLRDATDDVFFIPSVDRTQVRSLFTPNVRFTEVVEDGIAGGNVIPHDFEATEEGLDQVRKNILKAGIVGRLVANDFTGAIISAELMEVNPNTGERVNYIEVAKQLEETIREKYSNVDAKVSIDTHIIGFAKMIGDIADGAARVMLFFLITFVVTAILVYQFSQSIILTLISLVCSLTAVVWQLGLLGALGFGIDPMSILVPFLVFAIAVSHGVQMISALRAEVFFGVGGMAAVRNSFRILLVPGSIALLSDTVGFLMILLIDIEIIQEMGIAASLGVASIIFTNLFLLPVLLSYVKFSEDYKQRLQERAESLKNFWFFVSRIGKSRNAAIAIVIAILLFGFGAWKARDIRIGDIHHGVPELRSDSRYNIDSDVITSHFSIGVDVLTVIVETVPDGCIDYHVMTAIDDFAWHVQNISGVQSVIALPTMAKLINAGWNEGSLKWRVLPRYQPMLVQSVAYISTSSGLLNNDCSLSATFLVISLWGKSR